MNRLTTSLAVGAAAVMGIVTTAAVTADDSPDHGVQADFELRATNVRAGENWYPLARRISECETDAQVGTVVRYLQEVNPQLDPAELHLHQIVFYDQDEIPACEPEATTTTVEVTTTTEAPTTTVEETSTTEPATTTTEVPPSSTSTSLSPSTTISAPSTTQDPTTTLTSTSTTSTTSPSTTTSPPPSEPSVPTLSQVGPRGLLASRSGTNLPCGTYTSVSFTSTVELNNCAYTFIDADIPRLVQRGNSYVGPGPKVTLSHSAVRAGIWFEYGGHTGWSAEWTLFDGRQSQAIRPKGPGTMTIKDSILLTAGTNTDPALGIHTESMQTLCDGGCPVVKAERVGFSVEPRWNGGYTPITAVVNLGSIDSASLFTDCTFGYLRAGTWTTGGGYFKIYPGAASFVRPTVYTASGTMDSAWYENRPPAGSKLVNPVYLKG